MLQADAETQAEIREESPDKTHCRYLERCPRACTEFPETITDAAGKVTVDAGSPCPNNPFEQPRVKAMTEALENKAGLLGEGDRMGDLVDLGLLPGLYDLTPEEFEAARIVRGYRRAQELRVIAGVRLGVRQSEE